MYAYCINRAAVYGACIYYKHKKYKQCSEYKRMTEFINMGTRLIKPHSGLARSIFVKWSRKLWRHLWTLLQIDQAGDRGARQQSILQTISQVDTQVYAPIILIHLIVVDALVCHRLIRPIHGTALYLCAKFNFVTIHELNSTHEQIDPGSWLYTSPSYCQKCQKMTTLKSVFQNNEFPFLKMSERLLIWVKPLLNIGDLQSWGFHWNMFGEGALKQTSELKNMKGGNTMSFTGREPFPLKTRCSKNSSKDYFLKISIFNCR
jgi:hypothetical protein